MKAKFDRTKDMARLLVDRTYYPKLEQAARQSGSGSVDEYAKKVLEQSLS